MLLRYVYIALGVLVVSVIFGLYFGLLYFLIGYGALLTAAVGLLAYRYVSDVDYYEDLLEQHFELSQKAAKGLEDWTNHPVLYEEATKLRAYIRSYIQALINYADVIRNEEPNGRAAKQ